MKVNKDKYAKLNITRFHNWKPSEVNNKINGPGNHLLPTNILVTGITGCGISTLINSILQKCNIPISVWETAGIELFDYDSDSINVLLGEFRTLVSGEDRIDCIWYCKNANYQRFGNLEEHFISDLKGLGIPLIIVLTECISEKSGNRFQSAIASILDNNIPIIQVLAEEKKIEIDNDKIYVIPARGLDELISSTMNCISKE